MKRRGDICSLSFAIYESTVAYPSCNITFQVLINLLRDIVSSYRKVYS